MMRETVVKSIVLAILLGLPLTAGCGCERENPYPLAAASSEEMLSCASDEDCVLSYLTPRGCCGIMCGTTRYNKTVALRLKQWHEEACREEQCPLVDCGESEFEDRAVCRSGMCETESIKIGDPSDEE